MNCSKLDILFLISLISTGGVSSADSLTESHVTIHKFAGDECKLPVYPNQYHICGVDYYYTANSLEIPQAMHAPVTTYEKGHSPRGVHPVYEYVGPAFDLFKAPIKSCDLPIVSCVSDSTVSGILSVHFLSNDTSCEGIGRSLGILGYACRNVDDKTVGLNRFFYDPGQGSYVSLLKRHYYVAFDSNRTDLAYNLLQKGLGNVFKFQPRVGLQRNPSPVYFKEENNFSWFTGSFEGNIRSGCTDSTCANLGNLRVEPGAGIKNEAPVPAIGVYLISNSDSGCDVALQYCKNKKSGESFLSVNPNCEGQIKNRFVGWICKNKIPGTSPLYRSFWSKPTTTYGCYSDFCSSGYRYTFQHIRAYRQNAYGGLVDDSILGYFPNSEFPSWGTAEFHPLIYSYEYYLDANPDLRAAGLTSPFEIAIHWLKYGINEGRRASPGFSVKEYLELNPDVKAHPSYASNKGAMQHYVTYGIAENRKAARENRLIGSSAIFKPEIFNSSYYFNNNPDLVSLFTKNESEKDGIGEWKLKKHWKEYGVSEGRRAANTFSVREYLRMNPDVSGAFGKDNYLAAMEHFVNYGIKEMRSGIPIWPSFKTKPMSDMVVVFISPTNSSNWSIDLNSIINKPNESGPLTFNFVPRPVGSSSYIPGGIQENNLSGSNPSGSILEFAIRAYGPVGATHQLMGNYKNVDANLIVVFGPEPVIESYKFKRGDRIEAKKGGVVFIPNYGYGFGPHRDVDLEPPVPDFSTGWYGRTSFNKYDRFTVYKVDGDFMFIKSAEGQPVGWIQFVRWYKYDGRVIADEFFSLR